MTDPKTREDAVGGDEAASDEETSFNDEETVVLAESDFTDNVGDVSVEINVEELVSKIEEEQTDDAKRKKEIRRRLEEVAESKDFDDTYAVDFDD